MFITPLIVQKAIMRYVLSCILCLFLLSGLFFGTPLQAQNGAETPITMGIRTIIQSEIMGEDRPVLIYTPDSYDQSTATYPVIYLLDGDGHLLHTAGTTQFLARNGKMPEAIIVGLPNTDRTRDLTPALSSPNENFPTAGGADTFLSFIGDELAPYIEANYRTAPYRILIGHSFGGLFSVNALMKRPELFNAHISISPSLWWDNKGLLPKAEVFFDENRQLKNFYYMTMGNEGGAMLSGAWGFAGIMEEKAPRTYNWHFELMEEETHGSIPLRSTYDGLEMLYDGWTIGDFSLTLFQGGMAAIDEHYAALSERFGYTIETPEADVNRAGYILIQREKFDDAIAAFERNISNFPGSVNAYDSAGDGYKAKGDIKQAVAHYEKACNMGKASNHPNAAVYCNNLAEAKKSME